MTGNVAIRSEIQATSTFRLVTTTKNVQSPDTLDIAGNYCRASDIVRPKCCKCPTNVSICSICRLKSFFYIPELIL